MERDQPTDREYEDATSWLEEALAIFDGNPVAWRKERRETLEHLQYLYTTIWEDPNRLAVIEAELRALEAPPPEEQREPVPVQR